eukprot:14393361-Alexandrium_andersonii.AAC.1
MSLEALSYARPELLRDVLGIPLGRAIMLLVAVAQRRAAALVPPAEEAAQPSEALRVAGLVPAAWWAGSGLPQG